MKIETTIETKFNKHDVVIFKYECVPNIGIITDINVSDGDIYYTISDFSETYEVKESRVKSTISTDLLLDLAKAQDVNVLAFRNVEEAKSFSMQLFSRLGYKISYKEVEI